MSVEVLSETTPVARKEHDCLACDWAMASGYNTPEDLTGDEWNCWLAAKENGFKIKKGQKYVRQNNKSYGDMYTFTAIPAIHNICLKYDLYEV